jgi:glycosyltransferase involved in cell wall biosynthesis
MALALRSRGAVPDDRVAVAIVLTSFEAGGTERQMTELIRRLDASRFRVHVACFRRHGQWLPGVEAAAHELVEFPLRSFRTFSGLHGPLRQFTAWLRRRQIALVHACDRYANIFALPAAAFAAVPVRIGSRRELRPPGATGPHLIAQRCAYATAHRIVANSRSAAERLRYERIPASKIAVIANGIDLERYAAAPPREMRRTVATVANLRPGKGHDVLLRAASLVLRVIPDARFRIVGDGPLRGDLERLSAESGLADAVQFLGYREDVPAVLADSDLFAFPSLTDAFPNGLIEGMAAGLPAVASGIEGIAELIDTGTNGLLVPPHDASALAGALIDLMQHPARAAMLGDAARRTIERRYSFTRMVSEFETLYADEIALRRPRPALVAGLHASGGAQPPDG